MLALAKGVNNLQRPQLAPAVLSIVIISAFLHCLVAVMHDHSP